MQTKTLKKRLKPFPQLQSVGMPRNPEPLDRLVTSVINLVGHHYTGRPSKTRGIDPQPTDQLFFLRYLLLRVELWPALGTGNQRFLFCKGRPFAVNSTQTCENDDASGICIFLPAISGRSSRKGSQSKNHYKVDDEVNKFSLNKLEMKGRTR